jgi:hypothetical protein
VESYGIDESIAEDLIDLIRNGHPLPPRIVRLLHEIPSTIGDAEADTRRAALEARPPP